MHRIVESHLNYFVNRFGILGERDKQFESFLNFSIFRQFCLNNVEPDSLRYDGDDPGIDGIMIFVGDEYVGSPDEVREAFSGRKRDIEVHIVFTQAKTSEKWEKGEINKFQSAVQDFLSGEPEYPQDEYVKNQRHVFDEILNHVGKIKEGKPHGHFFFCTTAPSTNAREILAAERALTNSVKKTGLFLSIEVGLLDRDRLISLWNATSGSIETKLPILGNTSFIKAPGITQAYVATCRVSDFIKCILSDEKGKLRQSIFDQNVRDFLGKDSEINSEMATTLEDRKKQIRFGILNNGVTIISPDVRLSGFELTIKDFQIVNGCQTSNVLFEHSNLIESDTTLMLKIVETSDKDVVDDIVRSTNRQAKVNEDQFLSTLDCARKIEKYFEIRGRDFDHRLYFERRTNQYASHQDVKAIRVFDIRELSRCFSSMFLDKPDVSSRYPNKLTKVSTANIFNRDYQEDLYYISAFTLYRIKLFISSGRIPSKYGKLRWHILMAIKYYILGKDIPEFNSKKIEACCGSIERFVSSNDEAVVKLISRLSSSLVDIETINSDNLKSNSLVQSIKEKALVFKKDNPLKTKI